MMEKVKRFGAVWGMIAAAVYFTTALPVMAAENDPSAQSASVAMEEQYLAIQTALASDSLDQASQHASALLEMTIDWMAEHTNRDSEAADSSGARIPNAVASLARAKTLEDARAAFAELSDAIIHINTVIATENLKLAYCPMAKKYWFQTGDAIANPYYGSAMLRCGKFVKQVAAASEGH